MRQMATEKEYFGAAELVFGSDLGYMVAFHEAKKRAGRRISHTDA